MMLKKSITLYSKEHLGKIEYKTQKKAMDKLPEVYKYLRETYG